MWQFSYKPDSVLDHFEVILGRHSSGSIVTNRLKRPTRETSSQRSSDFHQNLPLFGLAPDGVCRANLSPSCW
jgi:hypothetical protein